MMKCCKFSCQCCVFPQEGRAQYVFVGPRNQFHFSKVTWKNYLQIRMKRGSHTLPKGTPGRTEAVYALYLRQYVFSNCSWYMTPMYRNLSNSLTSHLARFTEPKRSNVSDVDFVGGFLLHQQEFITPACSNRLVEAFDDSVEANGAKLYYYLFRLRILKSCMIGIDEHPFPSHLSPLPIAFLKAETPKGN